MCFLCWSGQYLQRLDFYKAMSIFVCSEAGQIISRPSFPKSFGKILFLSPPASPQRIHVSECANTAFPNASEIWPIWGLNIHLVFFCSRASWILLWFHALMDSLSSRSPPVNLVPSSDLISLTWPLLPINRLNAIKRESVSKLRAIFMCSARIAKHVEIPTDVGRRVVAQESDDLTGRSAIFCS